MSIKITSVDEKTGRKTVTIIEGNTFKGYNIKGGRIYKRSFIGNLIYKIKKAFNKYL